MSIPNVVRNIYANVFVAFSKRYSRKGLSEFVVRAARAHYRQNMKVINAGAGGALEALLLQEAVAFTSVDIDPQRAPDLVIDLQSMPTIEDNSVDLFFLLEVLEHIPNPQQAVNEIWRVLRPGGRLVGSTPFIFPIHDEPHDYYRYTRYGLAHLFSNFQQLELFERNSYSDSAFVVMLRLINVGSARQRFLGILLLPLFLVYLPLLLVLNLVFRNRQATTGYCFVFEKK